MNIDTKVWETLCSKEDIAKRVAELGKQISEDYQGQSIHVISLLKGSFMFTSDLVRQITVPLKVSFMVTSSYGHGTSTSGEVRIEDQIKGAIEGEHILVVDDITDSGITMKKVLDHLKEKKPASLKSCVLLDKPSRRAVDLQAHYIGFEIEDKFVVGYGLNYGDYYRNTPYVFAVTDQDR